MKKVIVIGCPGAGKSTFARKLREKTGLPLYHLDLIWHRPDKSHITREAFDQALDGILKTDSWIIDGNYSRTLELRMKECDTIFFLDLPTAVCLQGAQNRIGVKREDMPWVEAQMDAEFKAFIMNFAKDERPGIYTLLEKYPDKHTVIFHSQEQINQYLMQL